MKDSYHSQFHIYLFVSVRLCIYWYFHLVYLLSFVFLSLALFVRSGFPDNLYGAVFAHLRARLSCWLGFDSDAHHATHGRERQRTQNSRANSAEETPADLTSLESRDSLGFHFFTFAFLTLFWIFSLYDPYLYPRLRATPWAHLDFAPEDSPYAECRPVYSESHDCMSFCTRLAPISAQTVAISQLQPEIRGIMKLQPNSPM